LSEHPKNGRVIASGFRAAGWLANRHLQTIYPSLPWARGTRPSLERELLELPDGDVTVVDRLAGDEKPNDDRPMLVLLHGLESSAESNYAQQLLKAAADRKWHAAVLHFRDCGDYRNRLPRRYHAGETNDLRYFLNKLRTEGYQGPILAVGYSLGGNVLLKYLGEDGALTPVDAAVAVCVPLSLQRCADALMQGFSRVYQRHLLRRMKLAVARKFNPHTAAFDWDRAMHAATFGEFDDAVTAPLHGFTGKDEYYETCSSIRFLGSIERPTLIINARDDPFMMPDMLPGPEDLARDVTLEISEQGGHVGFISGGTPWRPTYYLPGRVIGFLEDVLANEVRASPALPGL
jgi:predicted alpha/beta-fold hydrolase